MQKYSNLSLEYGKNPNYTVAEPSRQNRKCAMAMPLNASSEIELARGGPDALHLYHGGVERGARAQVGEPV